METARRARAEGAEVILTGRDPERLRSAAQELGAAGTASFDANDAGALEAFFAGLEGPIDQVMATAGQPYYSPLAEMDFEQARRSFADLPMQMLGIARFGAPRMRPGGTLIFVGGTGGRHTDVGLGVIATVSPPGCSARGSKRAAGSCARRCRSGGSSSPRTSPRWRST
jgi:NADP-dependent 3-hydroxy acid dehydrogenase YdfG